MGYIDSEDDLLAQEIQNESETKARRKVLQQLENERQNVIKQRLEIAQKRNDKFTQNHQSDTTKNKSKNSGSSSTGCFIILAIIAAAVILFVRICNEDSDTENSTTTPDASQEISAAEMQAEKAVDLQALEETVYDWIKNHENYDVTHLSLSRTDIPLHYEGTITWNRYGRSFTNMLVVQYFLENGGITWHVDESQEELDYVAAHEGGEAISTMKMAGSVNEEPAHLYIESFETKIVGYYYFDREGIQHKRNLGGDYDKSSSRLRLLETNADDATVSVFEGQLNCSSTYTGSYTNILNNVNAQFEFHKTSN